MLFCTSIIVLVLLCYLFPFSLGSIRKPDSCRFALNFQCKDFFSSGSVGNFAFDTDEGAEEIITDYLNSVIRWESKFAVPGVGLDHRTLFTYDGHPLNYTTGDLYGSPHTFSAPSKESLHVALLALSLSGNSHARSFVGGFNATIDVLETKIRAYNQFNSNFPGFGCFTPWVTFDSNKGIVPLPDWATRVPALDNGEWFWSLYAVSHLLNSRYRTSYPELASQYASLVRCQIDNVKTIFYRGSGLVSAVVKISDVTKSPSPEMYTQEGDGLMDDPYEGETVTQMLYLFSSWDSEKERDLLWQMKRDKFQKTDYIIPDGIFADNRKVGQKLTVQKGWWFSSHEQWKLLLLPYLSNELPLVRKVFLNAEKARTIDAYASHLPGLMASINDVTNGSEDIPCYASACGISSLAFQNIERRDLMTPYGSFPIFLQNQAVGFCWYNNMLRGPRMQSSFGSTEAINANSTEISPLTTWDSKITTVVAMLGGISEITAEGLHNEHDSRFGNSFNRFVYVVNREHSMVFGSEKDVYGGDVPFALPKSTLGSEFLSDWELSCAK